MTKSQLLEAHFKEHKDSLVKRAKYKLGEYWAEDAVQDTYERCLRYLDNLPEDAGLIAAYVNTALRSAIKEYRRDNVGYVEVEEDMLESGELVDGWGAKGVLRLVKRDISKLPSPNKEVVYCALIHGESYDIISKTTGVTVPNVKTIVRRFRKELEERYA